MQSLVCVFGILGIVCFLFGGIYLMVNAPYQIAMIRGLTVEEHGKRITRGVLALIGGVCLIGIALLLSR